MCAFGAGQGSAVEVFVSLRLITSLRVGQGPTSGGSSGPAEGKCLGGCRGATAPVTCEPPEHRASLSSGGRWGGGGKGLFDPTHSSTSQAVFSGGLKRGNAESLTALKRRQIARCGRGDWMARPRTIASLADHPPPHHPPPLTGQGRRKAF